MQNTDCPPIKIDQLCSGTLDSATHYTHTMSHSTSPPSSPAELVSAAINADSVSQLEAALERAADTSSMTELDELLNSALAEAVSKGSVELTKYVIGEGAEVSTVDMFKLSSNPSIALFEVLHSHGYNFNKAYPKNALWKGRSVIYKLLHDEALVNWLINHGVSVDTGEEEFEMEARPPLLLETCACLGSVASFKLLKAHGAKVAPRSLHVAVGEAAAVGADPSKIDSNVDEQSGDGKHKTNMAEMVRYLVDELHLDVNALDGNELKPNHWGPPLNYAAKEPNGAAVVKWLLDKGADPNTATANMRPEQLAKSVSADQVLQVLESHK